MLFNIQLCSRWGGIVNLQTLIKILHKNLDKNPTSWRAVRQDVLWDLEDIEIKRTQYYCPHGYFWSISVEFQEMPLGQYWLTNGRRKHVVITFHREEYYERFTFNITRKMLSLKSFAAAEIVNNLKAEEDIYTLELPVTVKVTLVEAFSDDWSAKYYKENVYPEEARDDSENEW